MAGQVFLWLDIFNISPRPDYPVIPYDHWDFRVDSTDKESDKPLRDLDKLAKDAQDSNAQKQTQHSSPISYYQDYDEPGILTRPTLSNSDFYSKYSNVVVPRIQHPKGLRTMKDPQVWTKMDPVPRSMASEIKNGIFASVSEEQLLHILTATGSDNKFIVPHTLAMRLNKGPWYLDSSPKGSAVVFWPRERKWSLVDNLD